MLYWMRKNVVVENGKLQAFHVCMQLLLLLSQREPSWDKYVDTYFTVDKFKEAYALEIGPMPGKDQWVNIETVDKIYPPIIKRPPGRPKKNRIIPHDEPKKRHKCPRCGLYGHHQRTCKNPVSQRFDEASSSKRKEHKRS